LIQPYQDLAIINPFYLALKEERFYNP